jgi:GrpB-like predicted nucleotidyltransferase (UPF0157 family)
LNIDEPISLEEYDEQWVRHYEAERERILAAISDIVVGIEHFGSTSIPGMIAKPTIDILVGVESLALRYEAFERLRRLGYEGFGEAGVAGCLYFRKRSARSYNLAIVEWGKDHWNNKLTLRDYLRSHPEVAACYAAHKRQICQNGAKTLLAYSDEKAGIMRELLTKSLQWEKSMRTRKATDL